MSPNGMLSAAIKSFKFDHGRYPVRLDQLLSPPPLNNDRGASCPYLDVDSKAGLRDPWGQPYQYRIPALHSNLAYDLWSCGPDGISGTADDITNW